MSESEPIPTQGDIVRKYRERAGLSMRNLAFRVRVDNTFIGRLEKGERNLSLPLFARLYRLFGERFALDLLDAVDDRDRRGD